VSDLPAIEQVVTLTPGDRVLVACDDERYDPDAVLQLQEALTHRFPGVVFVVMCGARVESVQKAGCAAS
jgi:hypothetical protein